MISEKSYTTLALFSGGLDSILAVKIVQQQGIKVIPICFKLGEEYLNIIKNPKYGYGKHLNPCIDCHAFMYNKLGKMMPKLKTNFLISGEVLGQRPKSQSIAGLNQNLAATKI